MRKPILFISLVLLVVFAVLSLSNANAQAEDPTFVLEGTINSPDGSGSEVTTDDDFDIIVNLWYQGATSVEFTIPSVDMTWVVKPTEGWTVEGTALKWNGNLNDYGGHVEAVLHVPIGAVSGTIEFTVVASDSISGYSDELTLIVHTPENYPVFLPVIFQK
jgi:hypothetical protein